MKTFETLNPKDKAPEIDYATRLAIFMQYPNCDFEAISHTTYVGECFAFITSDMQAMAVPSLLNPFMNLHRIKVLVKPLGEISKDEMYAVALEIGGIEWLETDEPDGNGEIRQMVTGIC